MTSFLKTFLTGVAAVFLVCFLIYLYLPSPKFPIQPHDSVQSLEEADIETPIKRAYFTNYTREEVLEHYQNQFRIYFLGIPIPNFRLNYPPEDAYLLIRDQTRSTFLEEIVYTFRGSFFVNGFKPKEAKDDIWYRGTHYEQKITVKYAQSPAWSRIPVALLACLLLLFILREWLFVCRGLVNAWKDKYL